MKLKLRMDAKDLVIFCIFCIVLLYIVAVVVCNVSEFAKYGTVIGLNPLPAFGKDLVLITLVSFFCILGFLFTSVSSLFFDREKGIGISTSAKKENGYSRWLTEKEMKKELKMVLPNAPSSEAAGIPLINDGKKLWVDDGEYHNLIIGSTGAGKTEMTIQPMVKVLAKKGESMIITDPKGEIYEKNAVELKEKGYNIVLLNFRNPQNGNCWNPLTLPYQLYVSGNQDKASELLEDLALNILYDESSKGQDPFWEKTSADYFAGLSLALFEDAKPEEINLNSINLMTTAGEDKIGNTTYIKEYFSDKDQASPAYINVASTLMAPSDTKSSILSVFKQKIKLFSSRENLSEMLSHSDFDMHEIGRKKTAVFIVIQDEKKTYHSLVTIFLKQCYETLINVAQESGGKLLYRTNFILDEFANMPPLKDVTTMVTAARSRKIRFSFVIQNFSQLYEVYGKEQGETIKGNCGNIIYLISSELSALEEISKLCGDVKSKEKDKTASTPLVTVSDLQRLPQNTLIAIRIRKMPFKTKLTPNWKMVESNSWGVNYPIAGYPAREKEKVKVFDIKKFVDKKKEAKVNSMLSNLSGGSSEETGGFNPFSSGMNPFAQQAPNKAPMPGGFDVDEMVRRIDAKIAELEEEERLEKLAQEQGQIGNENITDAVIEENAPVNEIEQPLNPVVQENVRKPVEQIKQLEKPIRNEENFTNFFAAEPVLEKVNIPSAQIVEATGPVVSTPLSKSNTVRQSNMTINKPTSFSVPIQPKHNPFIEKNNEYIEHKKQAESYVSDDEFFDDFFNEDE
ncbi:MAG: type IV secretory system conjugative DNA transfer family protein [Bacilli bacterium]